MSCSTLSSLSSMWKNSAMSSALGPNRPCSCRYVRPFFAFFLNLQSHKCRWKPCRELLIHTRYIHGTCTGGQENYRKTTQWYGHVLRRKKEYVVRRLLHVEIPGRRRRWQTNLRWTGWNRRHDTDNIRAVVEMKMEGKRPRGRPRLRWNDTIRRGTKAWKIGLEWTDRERWTGLCKTRYPAQGGSDKEW